MDLHFQFDQGVCFQIRPTIVRSVYNLILKRIGVLNEIRNRGVEDIFIISVDGLTGFAEAIGAVYPRAEIQRCISYCYSVLSFLHCMQVKKGRRICVDKAVVIWTVLLAGIAAGTLLSRKIKREIKETGIETDAVVSRIVDDGTQTDTDINVYVRYRTENGEEVEGVLSNPRPDLIEGQHVRIRYHPKYKTNARLPD